MEPVKIGAPILGRGMGYALWQLATKKFSFAAAQQSGGLGKTLLAEMNKASGVAAQSKGSGILA